MKKNINFRNLTATAVFLLALMGGAKATGHDAEKILAPTATLLVAACLPSKARTRKSERGTKKHKKGDRTAARKVTKK